jgi:hypothetical protein
MIASRLRGSDQGLDNRPLVIGQIARVTEAVAIRRTAVLRLPHLALPKESSAQQGIISDSFDSRSFRIGSN